MSNEFSSNSTTFLIESQDGGAKLLPDFLSFRTEHFEDCISTVWLVGGQSTFDFGGELKFSSGCIFSRMRYFDEFVRILVNWLD